jgi:nicotinate-nucleotide--dimethylbenzimidazole phosphoribosyltransferase
MKEAILKAYERLDSLTKPKRSLGYLEELSARFAAIRNEPRPTLRGKKVFVFVGDHKVVEEGVSAYPSEVTGLMVKNFLNGGAAINVLARCAGAEVEVIDIGMANDPGNLQGLLKLNVKRGADNISKGPAMTPYEAKKAILLGIDRLNFAANIGVNLVATGEMGIGNTTPAAALYSSYLGIPVTELVGSGTGLDTEGILKKTKIIEKAIEINKSRCTGPIETLAALGGLEIAGICGLCLGAASRRIPVIVDGYISTAGALAAMMICPTVKDYMFFSHMSAEPGHKKFYETANLRPVLDLGMRLGEGTGAVIAMQIIQDAVAIYNEMATFDDAGITPGA